MERIEALIRKLNEQFQQNADPALLLGTVQLLQFELTKVNSNTQQSLGTAKVAVVLPIANVVGVAAGYEKYAPRAVEKSVEDVKETILVDKGSLSVVQGNGQLDMIFDPMTEIPTFSNQLREPGKEVNDASVQTESLNDKLRQGKTELVEVLKETPVKDLRKAVGINDRFLFINDLFRGDENMYERSIKTINSFSIYAEAEYWISRELKTKLGWSNDHPSVQHFDQLVKRRFS
ncbi:MAG TPA: hypothetical protein VIV35_08935 [Chitinophagaceae bacterium]